MDGVTLTPLRQILNPKGDILHAIKKSDQGFAGFGEAYFSTVYNGVIKGWKKHTKMTLNLVVPSGVIEFVCFDGKEFQSIVLSQDNYQRLTVNPGVWVAFRGKNEGLNLLLNVASIEHDPAESENCSLEDISYDW
jgi:dTDP-4-dehydrorhamnose 3,5-epimerase